MKRERERKTDTRRDVRVYGCAYVEKRKREKEREKWCVCV